MNERAMDSQGYERCVPQGLALCGVDRLFLQVHDASFPGFEADDTRRGSPYSPGAHRFLTLVRRLGFNGVQLGPQGATSITNASPYDGTLFSRNPLSLALAPLVEEGLLEERQLSELLAERPGTRDRVEHRFAFAIAERVSALLQENLEREPERFAGLRQRLQRFRHSERHWLDRDLAFAVLFERHQRRGWQSWQNADGTPHSDQDWYARRPAAAERARLTQLLSAQAVLVERAALVQLLLHEQHARLRQQCRALGLRLYADLQIGASNQDAWAYRHLFLPGYLMGAPPSRTNPEGQPWGFRVLDPDAYLKPDGTPGPVLRFVSARLRKIYAEYDGVRVDHPHGWVCPWVYRADIEDAFEAVRTGARLFSSPDLPDHPGLARYSIVSAAQLTAGAARHADDWVQTLTSDQIDRYQRLFARLVSPDGASRQQLDLVCEVLSTLPYPLKCVLDRFGLGRFRVLQKVNTRNPLDVYRSEHAEPVDWIMLGNHDTPPIWSLADRWVQTGESRERAQDLCTRLAPPGADRDSWIQECASDAGCLVHALFADLLVSPARNIMVFFADVLGLSEPYNVPGTVNDINWSLRVPPSYSRSYLARLAKLRALSLPDALAIALRSPRFHGTSGELLKLIDEEALRLRHLGTLIGA